MKRREFIQTAVGAGALTALSAPLALGQSAPAVTALEKDFHDPPADAGISVVHHWTGGVATKEGITADLEHMAATGVNVCNWFYFDGNGTSDGVQTYPCKSTEWWALVDHLFSEAKRVGVQIAPHVCSSWGPAGAPGITPELSQQALAWSEAEAEAGRPFTAALPRPQRAAGGRGGGGGGTGGGAAGAAGAAGAVRGAVGAQAPAGAAAAAGPAGAPGAGGGGGGRGGASTLPSWNSYYRDLAVLAFPVPADWRETSVTRQAKVTGTLPITDFAKATDPANSESVVSTDRPGYIQFAFDQPFTLRAVTMNPGGGGGGFGGGGGGRSAVAGAAGAGAAGAAGTAAQAGAAAAGGGRGGAGGAGVGSPYRIAHGLEVQASDDGTTFRKIGQLEPMNNGWQSSASTLTHTVTQTRARYFRLVYTPGPPVGYDEGMRTGTRTSPGDFANMVEPLSFASVVLSSTPTVHHLPAKSMTTWGKGSRLVIDAEIPASACVPLDSIVDLSRNLNDDGTIGNWTPPGTGKWRVMRFGYLSMMSSTGGGLQADKLSRDAARIVFNAWFGEFRKRLPNSEKLIPILNIDSWEGGSQNWSPLLAEEFRSRRGYEVTKYLPCMAGVMIQSPTATEGFLLDVRRTISQCIADNFYGEFYRLAHENNAIVMSEDVNPALAVDGLEYFKNTDWTGGEFWVRAAQNWKPNDMHDGISAARIYGKKVIFAEAFTGGSWQDHPFALKAMGDYNFADGLNRMMLHVWNAQYYPNRMPGQPGAGTPFNFLNTWWAAGQGWRDYMKKAQALLQSGMPTADALYFIGEEIPCRSILNPKLGCVWYEDPALPDGYRQESINRDALLRLAKVQPDGQILVSGIKYKVLVLRASEPFLTVEVAAKIKELVEGGATVVGPKPTFSPSWSQGEAGQVALRQIADQVWGRIDGKTVTENRPGKGRVFWGNSMAEVLSAIGVTPDVTFSKLVETATGNPVVVNFSAPKGASPVQVGAARKGWGMWYGHRAGTGFEIYFLSNQEFFPVSTEVSFRQTGKIPEFWYADTGKIEEAPLWREQNGRTVIPMEFDPSGSVFVVFRKASAGADPVIEMSGGKAVGPKRLRLAKTAAGLETWAADSGEWTLKTKSGKSLKVKATAVPEAIAVTGNWSVNFPTVKAGPKRVDIPAGDWTASSDEDVKYYSGTATYLKTITIPATLKAADKRIYLDLGDVQNIARVKVNGKDLGLSWKAPYVVDITAAAVAGANRFEIEITNTWVNRMAGDAGKPAEQRVTNASAGGRGGGGGGASGAAALLPAGLIGPVRVTAEVKVTPA